MDGNNFHVFPIKRLLEGSNGKVYIYYCPGFINFGKDESMYAHKTTLLSMRHQIKEHSNIFVAKIRGKIKFGKVICLGYGYLIWDCYVPIFYVCLS